MIDEKKLIEDIEKEFDGVCVYDVSPSQAIADFVDIVDRQPKVGEWIPCSERLPDEEEAYYYNEEEDVYEPNEFIVMVEGATLPTVAMFDGEDFTGGYNNEFLNKIIAWMPLPEPYRKDVE